MRATYLILIVFFTNYNSSFATTCDSLYHEISSFSSSLELSIVCLNNLSHQNCAEKDSLYYEGLEWIVYKSRVEYRYDIQLRYLKKLDEHIQSTFKKNTLIHTHKSQDLLFRKSLFFHGIKDYPKAKFYLDSLLNSLDSINLLDDHSYENYNISMQSLGSIEQNLGRVNSAKEYYTYALLNEQIRANKENRTAEERTFFCRLARIEDKLGNSEEAERLFKTCNKLSTQAYNQLTTEEKAVYVNYYIPFHRDYVAFLIQKEKLNDAKQVIDYISKIQLEGNPRNFKTSLVFAKAYHNIGLDRKCNELLEKIANDYETVGLDDKSEFLIFYTQFLIDKGDPNAALLFLSNKMPLFESKFQDQESINHEIDLSFLKFQCFDILGDHESALLEINKILSAIRNSFRFAVTFEDHIYTVSNYEEITYHLIKYMLRALPDRHDLLFELIEVTKSIDLYKNHLTVYSNKKELTNDDLIEHKFLIKSINQIEQKIVDGDSSLQVKNSLLKLKNEIKTVKTKLNQQSTILSDLLKPLLLNDLQEKLEPSNLYLDYYSYKDVFICLSISSSFTRIQEISSNRANSAINNYQKELLHPTSMDMAYSKAASLYSALNLDKFIKYRHLLVSPSRQLFTIPFYTLVDEKNSFLLEKDLNISNVHSARFFINLSASNAEEIEEVAYVYSGNIDDSTIGKEDLFQKDSHLSIKRIYNTTPESLKDQIKNIDLIHFTTHGVVNIENPSQSHLVLNSANNKEGKLYLRQLNEFSFKSKALFIAACSSGKGKVVSGEGVLSLSRYFIENGARSIISSLWDINDKSSSEISNSFYKELIQGKTFLEAKKTAQKKYFASKSGIYRHPSYWGGLIISGDAKMKLSVNNKYSFFLYLFIPFLVGASLLYYSRFRKV